MTNEPGRFLTPILLCGVIFAIQPLRWPDRPNTGSASPLVHQGPTERDGQHDFDFEFGPWKARLSRLQQPLTGSTTWLDYEGTSVVRKVWDGRANLGELDVSGPAGHIEGLTLRLYSPKSRQWNISWANASDPGLGDPMTGEFKDGRGEFYGKESFNGRMILVRFVFSDITPTAFRFEQAFSPDWGKTWEVNWKATFTR